MIVHSPTRRESVAVSAKAALVALAVVVQGCSLDFVPEDRKKKPADTSGDLGAFAELTLTSGASSTVSLQTGVAMNIPEGAYSGSVELRLERPREEIAEDFASRWSGSEEMLTIPHALTPYEVEFSEPGILTLPVPSSYTEDFVTVLRLDNAADTTWESAGPAPVEVGRAFVPLDRLGIYMLVAFDPANFDWDGGLGDLNLDDFRSYLGEFDGGVPEGYEDYDEYDEYRR